MNISNFKGTDMQLSGERIKVTYKIFGEEEEALKMAKDICLEDTIGLPENLIPGNRISSQIKGTVDSLESPESEVYYAVVSFAVEAAEGELTQLLNVVFGNLSIKPGVQVVKIELPESLLSLYNGPRCGISGLRKLLGIQKRPLLSADLKPIGLTSEELSKLAYELALNGIDIIRDDHALTDQTFAPFDERVSMCCEAVRKANSITGFKSIYVPNITAPYDEIFLRAETAKKEGAGGLLICPGLTGFDAMRCVTDDINIALPIFSHPAFLGSFTVGPDGISHSVIYGQIVRLAGADVTIFPNYDYSFSINEKDCREIVSSAKDPLGHIKNMMPNPIGSAGLESLHENVNFYGNDVILQAGRDLYQNDIGENCIRYRNTLLGIVRK